MVLAIVYTYIILPKLYPLNNLLHLHKFVRKNILGVTTLLFMKYTNTVKIMSVYVVAILKLFTRLFLKISHPS